MEYDYEKQEKNEQDSENLLDESEARKMNRELDRLISNRRQQKRIDVSRKAGIVIAVGVLAIMAISLISFNVIHDHDVSYDDDDTVYETIEGHRELPIEQAMSFTMDDVEMRLPVTLKTFLDMGWEVEEDEYSSLPEIIDEDDYVTVNLSRDNLDLYSVRLDVPTGQESCRGEEAEITGMSILASEDIDFEDCFGITTDMDPDDVEEILEDADITFDKYESEYSESFTVYFDAGDEYGSLNYYCYDDEVDTISINYSNFD